MAIKDYGVGVAAGTRAGGGGPGEITPDGCPVEVYRRLPPSGEAELVHRVAAAGAAVLDLGAGVGRVARPLADLGHRVVAVDESPAMLALVEPPVVAVRSRIQTLALGERFGAVLLASHLVNTSEADRTALLAAAARHLTADGVLVVQWHPPAWFGRLEAGGRYGGTLGTVESELEVLRLDARLMEAVVRYRVREREGETRWEQGFAAARLSVKDLDEALAVAGLGRTGWLTPDHGWFAAAPPAAPIMHVPSGE